MNSSGAYGFIFDMCGVEVDDTGRVRIDEYVTMHDAGKRLNPALVDGQIRGGFAHGLGAALYEELAYAERRELPVRHVRRLSRAHRVRGAQPDHPPHGDPLAVHPARGRRGSAKAMP